MTTRFLPRSLPVFLFLVLFLLVAGRSRAETYTVDAFGDSITAGWVVYARDGNGCVGCGGYEPTLQSLLKSAGREAVVKNWGKGSETTDHGASRVDIVIAHMAGVRPGICMMLVPSLILVVRAAM